VLFFSRQQVKNYGPTLESLGIRKSSQLKTEVPSNSQPSTSEPVEEEPVNTELSLEGIDDAEIDLYILSEKEAKIKENLWMARNGAHMDEMARRRRLKEEEEERERLNPTKKRRTKKRAEIDTTYLPDAVYQVAKVREFL
jgi:transcription factor IIIB subunit 2